MPRLRISLTLTASVVLHAALLSFVLRAEPRPRVDDAPREDPWTGSGLEVDAIREPAPAPLERPAPLEPSPPSPVSPEAARAPDPAVASPKLPSPIETAEPDAAATPKTAATTGSASARTQTAAPAPPAAPSSPASDSPRVESATAADAGAESGAGVFGAVGLPPGVRHLALAFARALPKGAHTDAAFRELPLGKLGEARIRLRVDEDGKLGPLEFVGERARDSVPAPIVRMLENALRLLAFGRFSLSNEKLEPGVLALRVRVELSEVAPSVAENAQPNHVRELKGPASGGENPKRAWFILNSGRRVDAWVHED